MNSPGSKREDVGSLAAYNREGKCEDGVVCTAIQFNVGQIPLQILSPDVSRS